MRILLTLTCLVLVIGTFAVNPFEVENTHATPEMIKAYELAQRDI